MQEQVVKAYIFFFNSFIYYLCLCFSLEGKQTTGEAVSAGSSLAHVSCSDLGGE